MTDDQAQEILCRGTENATLLERLKAQMWRGANGMMREHAWYLDEAVERIEQLEAAVNELDFCQGEVIEAKISEGPHKGVVVKVQRPRIL